MSDRDDDDARSDDPDEERAEALRRAVLHKSMRRQRARQRSDESIWSWMASFGLVGWTVVVPTVVGLAIGRFIDGRTDSTISFTITLLLVGAVVGVAVAWHWVRTESQEHDGG